MNEINTQLIPVPGGEAFLVQPAPEATPRVGCFEVYGGQALVAPNVANLEDTKLACLILAAIGDDNRAIGSNLGIKEGRVRKALANSYPLLERSNRHAIGRYLLEQNVFTVLIPPAELDVTKTELRVLEQSSHGKTTKEIADTFNRSSFTIKTHLTRIADKHEQPSRNALLLRGLLSGQIV